MIQSIKPARGYVLGKETKSETGVVTTAEIADTRQYFEVLAVGLPARDYGIEVAPEVKPGDHVVVQKHAAEGDSPPAMLSEGYALFLQSRVMAIEDHS